MRIYRFLSALAVALILCFATEAFAGAPDCAVEVRFFSLPNDPAVVQAVVTLRPSAGHYLYGPETEEGLPTRLAAVLDKPDGAAVTLPVIAPHPVLKKSVLPASIAAGDGDTPIYTDPTDFLIRVPATAGALNLEVSGLLCAPTSCTPLQKGLRAAIPAGPLPAYKEPAQPAGALTTGTDAAVGPPPAPNTADDQKIDIPDGVAPGMAALFASFTPQAHDPSGEITELGGAIFFGFLAGMLLNLMPCVLPVVSLKFSALLAVSAMSDKTAQARAFRLHCLIFAAGILAWFLVLALLLGGAGWAWGEMFQSPVAISILALILFLLALGLFGVFSLPLFDLRVSAEGHPHIQAFIGGLLATLLATPCSGPLLGGVLSWALLQSFPVLTMTVFSVGLGMALPYGALALWPGLVHLLPRPGKWTIRLEQLLGFFLVGSSVYLVTLLPADWMPGALFCLTAVGFAAWLWGQVGHLGAGPVQRLLAKTGAVLVVGLALFLAQPSPPSKFSWETFNPQTFAADLGKEPMLLEFTADWCPSCKALEHTTLNKKRMERLQKRYNMRTIQVDLTRNDPTGMALLKSVGSASIPVLVLFPAGNGAERPVVLRDLVTPSLLEEALSQTF